MSVDADEFRMSDAPAARRRSRRTVSRKAIKVMPMDHATQLAAQVPIESASRSLAVSATSVREALARLESDGLVVKRSLSEYRSTEFLTRQGVEELFAMRLLLEPSPAALAGECAGDAELDRTENPAEEAQGLTDNGSDHAVYGHVAILDQQFRDALTEAPSRTLLTTAGRAPARPPASLPAQRRHRRLGMRIPARE